ncbi:MAG: alpha-L-arabinofuranosidase C-terminal domain-containing protein [Armatimonadota bacterium]
MRIYTLVAAALAGCVLSLASPAGPRATISVDLQREEGRVSPLLFSHFVEFMYTCVEGGLWGEKLRNGGFESLTPPVQGPPEPWTAEVSDGSAGSCRMTADEAYPQPGDRLAHSLVVDGTVRLKQAPVAFRIGETFRFSIWVRGKDTGSLRVALVDSTGRTAAAASLGNVGGEWRKLSARLRSTRSDRNGALVIEVRGKTVWLDRASLMPDSAQGGLRADVLKAIKALRPGAIRFPGGNFAQCYHWTDGIGDRDRRPVTINYAWSRWLESNAFGTDEFIRLCREVGAEPLICVNIGDDNSPNRVPDNRTERALRDAVAWVQYCNGSPQSQYGKRRAANGHPKPYRVKYWEIGNEIFGGWEIGHIDAATYADRYLRFYSAMKAEDPTIKVLACGADRAWNETLLKKISGKLDYLVLHHYYGSRSYADLAVQPLNYEGYLVETAGLLARYAPHAKLAVNEWNTSLGEAENHSMSSGVFAAAMMHAMMRQCQRVEMGHVSDLVNGWSGGVIQTDHAGLYVTPTYHVIAMQTAHHGSVRVSAHVNGPLFSSPTQGESVPVLDVVTTRSRDRVYISVLNRHPDQAVAASIDLRGVSAVRPGGRAHILTAPSVTSYNSMAHPDVVRPVTVPLSVRSAQFTHVFHPHSLTILEMPVVLSSRRTSGPASARSGPSVSIRGAGFAGWQSELLEGGERGHVVQVSADQAEVRGAPSSRFGLMSPPVANSDTHIMRFDVELVGYEGTNALIHVRRAGASGFADFVEFGIERGRLQVWGGPRSWSGPAVPGRGTLGVEVGPPGPGGRYCRFYYNGSRVYSFSAAPSLGTEKLQVFLYGWGDSVERWKGPCITVRRPPCLEVRVSAPGTVDLSSAELVVGGMELPVGGDGWSRTFALPAGRHEVTASANDCRVWTGQVKLVDGRTTRLDVRLLPLEKDGWLAEKFDGDFGGELGFRPVLLAGERQGRVSFRGGAVTVSNPDGNRYGVISAPIPGSDRRKITVEAKALGFDPQERRRGEGNVILSVLAGGERFADFAEWAVQSGGLNIWGTQEAWWQAEPTVQFPVELKVVVSAPDAGGLRDAEFYCNGRLMAKQRGVRSLSTGRELRVFLYGWNAATRWDWVRVR